MIVWSYGGGIQSVAIAVLIREGALPKPDLAVIADTSREVGTTWDYLYGVTQPYLTPIGLKIEVAPHTMARVDLYDATGLTLIPAYTSEGRKSSFCSGEWKRDVVERWIRLQGVKECDSWIGYSIDEQRRVKGDHRPWCHLKYPLCEKRISRAMCRRIIEAAGLPVPKKSRCFMCPHQTAEEWQEIKERPEEFAAAVALEKAINANDPQQKGLFLYSGRVPLEMADFAAAEMDRTPLFKDCEAGGCWT
jgi:hypothetical protein